jgi:hypothetical protein
MLDCSRVGVAAVVGVASAAPALAAAPVPTPIGVGPLFHPAARPAAVAAGRPVGRLRCSRIRHLTRAHVELFAHRRVVIIPSGIGLARSRTCSYPTCTVTPTGVVGFDALQNLTLGDFFSVWGRRLARDHLLGFAGRVHAYVAGRPWQGPVRAIPLRRHAQIVLEVGGYVPPHTMFLFGPGR